jgi:hypothetical protein
VVDVGLSDTEEAHLYITGGEGADYVALSHCWGSGTPLVTTTVTLEDRQTVIQFNELSKTFKDAVNVTRRLGIRYLWIDSLCIIQDSKEDWAREASRMSDVYNNATVTISVDAAASPSDGLFPTATERRSLNRTEKLSCKGTDGQANYIYVRFRQGDPFHVNSTVHSGELPGKTKLSTRGWVLQEELLSPRMLHFRREEMSWICPTYSRCECRIRPAQPIPHMFRESPTAFAPSAESTHRLHLEWPFVVANFTRRHLTYASDRLAAMSGLAGWIEQRTTDTYFGGLWYEDLAFQLLWYSETQGVEAAAPATRFQEPYAPSWSWTSVTGPISYYGRLSSYISSRHPEQAQYSIHPLLRIVGVWNLPQEPDLNKYGPIKSSIIQLYAHLIPAAYSRDTKLWHLDTTVKDFDPGSVRIHLDVPAEFAPETWPDDETDPARPKYCFVLAGRWRTGAMTILRKQAVCLLVRRMTTDADHSRLFENVLTFKTLLCEGDSYVRVGLVRGAGSVAAWEAAVERRIVHLL